MTARAVCQGLSGDYLTITLNSAAMTALSALGDGNHTLILTAMALKWPMPLTMAPVMPWMLAMSPATAIDDVVYMDGSEYLMTLQGDGTLSSTYIYQLPTSDVRDMVLFDYDGDGDLDLALGTAQTGSGQEFMSIPRWQRQFHQRLQL